jgi:hypothetical protein
MDAAIRAGNCGKIIMDSVLQLTPRQRVELFEQTTQQTGIDAVIVEKDFWVCWTLKELFRLPAIGGHDFKRRLTQIQHAG